MEQIVSTGIIDSYFAKLKSNLSIDVAIVGGGPSGIVAAYYLAKALERKWLFSTVNWLREEACGAVP